jgi:glycosyltransferase involved in cell wall biosynthesis
VVHTQTDREVKMPRTLLIMPAWNEEEAIGTTVAEARLVLPDIDVLVVDDGSTDNTVAVAQAAGASVLSLPYNLYAKRFDYDQAIQLDADGQHDPRNVSKVLAGLEHANISIGARFAGSGDYEVHGPRRWAMMMLAGIVSRLARTKLTDITSGFRAADREAIEQYVRYYPVEYLGDTVDSLVVALRSGLSATQVPVAMRPRQAGAPSNNPYKAAVYLGRSMFSLLVALTRRPVKRGDRVDEKKDAA